jgi:biotin transporter BioY
MYIIAIAWIYVVFMMSITEQSVIAGIMTFLLYDALPVTIIVYLISTPGRMRRRAEAEKSQNLHREPMTDEQPPERPEETSR